MTCGIYRIICANGEFYIGSSVTIEKRWGQHRRAWVLGKHLNPRLQNIYNKHGLEYFTFSILEETTRENLRIREQELINELNPELNLIPVNRDMVTPAHHEERREKYRERRRTRNANPETRARIQDSIRERKHEVYHDPILGPIEKAKRKARAEARKKKRESP